MSFTDIVSYVGSQSPNGTRKDVAATKADNAAQRSYVDSLCDPEPLRHRHARGVAQVEMDLSHAVLVVRESPRLGTRLDSRVDPLRRLLESKHLQARAPTGKIVFATDQFIMEHFQESDSERYASVYNFGVPIVQTNSVSGRQPRVYQYGGSLVSTEIDGPQFSMWQAAWDNWLRVTKNVTGGARYFLPYVIELTFRDQGRRGYLLSMSKSAQSLIPGQQQFGFSMFVIHEWFRTPTDQRELNEKSSFLQLAEETPLMLDVEPSIRRSLTEFTA